MAEKRKLFSPYSRPIKFVSSQSQEESDKSKELNIRHSSGDKVASLYRSITSTSTRSSPTKEPQNDTVYCKHCDSIVTEDYERHTQGIAHIMASNISHSSPADLLTLNGSNIGFRMLQAQGWEYEQGLGAHNQGRRLPVKTALKQDHLGLGHEGTSKKAITHRYKEIEKKAIEKHLKSLENKDAGKEIARKAKAESDERVCLLNYLKN